MKTRSIHETEILRELDLAQGGQISSHFPLPDPQTILYNFFLNLEDGYMYVAGSRIHLYRNEHKWAIVFEYNGYHTRQSSANINLVYVGNCIDYPTDKGEEHSYISNLQTLSVIQTDEFRRIENKKGTEMENFELVGKSVKAVKVRGTKIDISKAYDDLSQFRILPRRYDNSENLMGFEDLVRYLDAVEPELMSATESEIMDHLPKGIKKIMTIDHFYQIGNLEDHSKPSSYETYQQIARVLATNDTGKWSPTQKPNNHWANWNSGEL